MDLKNKLWKFATFVAVVAILLNPELMELAFFIDAIGLELFLILLELQVLALLSVFYNSRIRPLLKWIKSCYTGVFPHFTLNSIINNPAKLVYTAQGPAILMILLVFYAMTGSGFNFYH